MIVSLTIVRYRKRLIPFALLAMALHHLFLGMQKRCTFYRLLGSGRNGTFSLQPDWQQWGLLAVWDSREDFKRFYSSSFIANWWGRFAYEKWTMLCVPLQSRGKWGGTEPFGKPAPGEYNGPVAVLTRATIRLKRLKNFWADVDRVTHIMKQSPGYILSLGIGEAPVYRQATFSVWETVADVKTFAYQSHEHSEVIRKTREENWYSEELFARFKPVAAWGTLQGEDPLKGKIKFNTL